MFVKSFFYCQRLGGYVFHGVGGIALGIAVVFVVVVIALLVCQLFVSRYYYPEVVNENYHLKVDLHKAQEDIQEAQEDIQKAQSENSYLK